MRAIGDETENHRARPSSVPNARRPSSNLPMASARCPSFEKRKLWRRIRAERSISSIHAPIDSDRRKLVPSTRKYTGLEWAKTG